MPPGRRPPAASSPPSPPPARPPVRTSLGRLMPAAVRLRAEREAEAALQAIPRDTLTATARSPRPRGTVVTDGELRTYGD